MTKAKQLSIVTLTWPIFMEVLLLNLMGNVDTFMLSQYSDKSVAAVGVANQIIGFSLVMFGFISAGVAVILTQYIGAKKGVEVEEVSAVAIIGSLVFGIVVSGVFIIGGELFLHSMNVPMELMEYGEIFLFIVGGFIFVQSVLGTIGAILRSHGYTFDTLFITIIMNVLNIGGNAIVVFGLFGFPVLGVRGVAIVTAVSRSICLLVAFAILLKRTGNPFKRINFRQFPFHHLREILRIGLPAAGETVSHSGYQIMLTIFITSMGTMALTTRIYVQNINTFIFLFSATLAQGAQIMIGQLAGAGKHDEIYQRSFRYLKISIVVSTLGAVLCYFLAGPLLSLFTSDAEVISTGRILFALIILLEPGRAFNMILIGSLRATGDVKFPFYVGVIVMWGVGVVVAYVFGVVFDLGLIGIWIALIADEWVRGIIMLFRWRSCVWKSKSVALTKAA